MPLPEVVWEGQSVRVRMQDPARTVCGGSFQALDRHAELVREAMLLEGDDVVEYSIGDEDFAHDACPLPFDAMAAACANGTSGDIFTSEPFIPHELVHGVRLLDPRLELRSPVIEEGLAMVYGGDYLPSYPRPLGVVEILNRPLLDGEDYYNAGQMMSKLLELHGVETFRRFDIQARSRGEDVAFSEVFGQSKEEFATFMDAGVACEQTQWWAPLMECDGEALTEDPVTGGLVLSGDLSCGGLDVVGPRYDRMWTSRHFRLSRRTSELQYRFEMPEDATLEIVSCEGGCPERFAYIGGRYDVTGVLNGVPSLEPGEYFLRMSRPVTDDDGSFEVVLY